MRSRSFSIYKLTDVAELIGTANANKNGLMTGEYYRKCIMRSFGESTFVKLITMNGTWQRCFVNVDGMCHSQLVSFKLRIVTNSTIKIEYYFNVISANKEIVKMYEKDNGVYLYFPSASQPFNGIIQSSNDYTFISGQPDDTYTEIPIE